MPRSLCWKDEYTEYMHEICPGRLTPEVTRLLNEKFGTNYTKTQIGGVRISNEELARMNQNNYFSTDPELTKLGAGITKLTRKITKKEK